MEKDTNSQKNDEIKIIISDVLTANSDD